MRQVQAVDERLAHIRVGVPGETAEPGFHGVYRLPDGREAGPVDYPLDGPDFLVGAARSVFTGRGVFRSGFDMFVVGVGVAVVGYFVGGWVGRRI